ncbi:unnamed protein product [Cylicostephanus goldi]|uniref:Photosynthesis system II assembly factor Ycf48/Hcf136-like domain-containing protein n=1 Tax=Cylicostephanus goldi TaxID=71465 RepID=A0A3P7LYI5_CYLGO|nr:unnamed protein product [Cylicostephanus goldi]
MVCLPVIDVKTAPVTAWSVRVSSVGLFLCTGKVMYFSRSALSGHRFPRAIPPKFELLDNFSLFSAGSFTGTTGFIHLCREDSEVFVYRPDKRNFVTLAIPITSQAVISLCGAAEKLLLIDSSGKLFSSDGETANWEAVTLPEPVCSVAHCKLSSWAVTCNGRILVSMEGSSVWSVVGAPLDVDANVVPTQVFASPNGIYVWVLAAGRGWARANINERNPIGTKWTEVQRFHL